MLKDLYDFFYILFMRIKKNLLMLKRLKKKLFQIQN